VELPRSSYTVEMGHERTARWSAVEKAIPVGSLVQFYTESRTAPDGTDRLVLFLTVWPPADEYPPDEPTIVER
jgi:hypothetical protein